MPKIFRGLVSVIVWLLFLKGCIGILVTGQILIGAMMDGESPPVAASIGCAVASFAFILACVAVWIRKKIE